MNEGTVSRGSPRRAATYVFLRRETLTLNERMHEHSYGQAFPSLLERFSRDATVPVALYCIRTLPQS
jgi:hypothetical protein